ncbi:(Fe-S)-binding protein [Egicoccus sp. AB-alg6-2]|uniref:(Fe-S)-binding protein n=1 Tax=Egicoccus sp. AB-alg6-2 TaxID=3242692 RepID=UPI00359E6FFC
MDLGLDRELLDACVQCGLCLTACPTYQVTGDESASPRGRIALMRAVQDGGAPVTDEVVQSFGTCIQCRGCEPACPSNVRFGHLMEQTRETLTAAGRFTPWWLRMLLRVLAAPRLLRAGTRLIALVQRLVPLPTQLGLPRRLPLRRTPLPASGSDVYLFTGCVMDAWQRDVHAATKRVLEAAGFGVAPTGDAAPCCGALHTHAGLGDEARALAQRVVDRLDDGRPVLVDSAGCGAAMKDYGHLLGSPQGTAFAARVHDVHEWLAANLDRLPDAVPLDRRVAIQDPCHLRHVQRVHDATRTVLRPYVRDLVELDDKGLCCGAGGSYSMVQPGLSRDVRDLKVAAIERVGPDLVASANPGCSLHLAAAGVPAVHPMQILDRALHGRPA